MLNQEQLLFQQETDGGLIEVWQKNNRRWLNIDAVEQSSINIEKPELLLSPLHHAFLAALLFIDTPEKILLAGLGGGAFARYIHYRSPSIQGDAVEINRTVATVAKQFFDFPETGWKIHINAVQKWQGECYDLVIADIAEAELSPVWLISEAMLMVFKKQLSERGVLVINLLVSNAQSLSQSLANIRKVFERKTLCLTVPDHKNIVVFAFKKHSDSCSDTELNLQAKVLSEVWGVNFSGICERLRSDNPASSLGGDVF
jgi:spermidine synthase